MSWETLSLRHRPPKVDGWGISVGRSGTSIYLPRDHDLASCAFVATQVGRGEHAGWLRLSGAKSDGRKVMRQGKNGRPFLRYSTLPGAPKELGMTELEVRPTVTKDVVEIRLPWGPAGSVERSLVVAAPAPSFRAASSPASLRPAAQKKSAPPMVDRASEADKINQFLASRGASKVMSVEQVAQFLRDSGYNVIVRKSVDGKTYAGTDMPTVDGEPCTVRRLFEMANDLRAKAGLDRLMIPA